MSQKNTELFETIYRATFNTISKYVYFKVAQLSDAEDIVQAIYIDFYNYIIKKNKRVENVQAYLTQMANHELSKYYKSKNELPITFSEENLKVIENIQDESDLEFEILNSNDSNEVFNLVKNLELIDQKILGARFRYDMTFKEIAQLLSVSENTIKTRYYRALKELKKLYIEQES
jgi:RNA polymerase sigma factor (sigma-70 family)